MRTNHIVKLSRRAFLQYSGLAASAAVFAGCIAPVTAGGAMTANGNAGTSRAYDPFARGAAPVGVRTIEVRDESRDGRTLPVELWYPATEKYRGQDLDDATRDHFIVVPSAPEL